MAEASHTKEIIVIEGFCRCEPDPYEALERAREVLKRSKPPKPPLPCVYFIGAADGPIKIGMSVNPTARLRGLQTAYPYELRILAISEGGGVGELAYHRQFSAHRLHGEWFARCPEIEAEIARLGGEA